MIKYFILIFLLFIKLQENVTQRVESNVVTPFQTLPLFYFDFINKQFIHTKSETVLDSKLTIKIPLSIDNGK